MPNPSTPLCVLLPEIGLASETFLQWEVVQLLPGQTAVIADPPPQGMSITDSPTWGLTGQPSLVFAPVPGDPLPCEQRQRDVAHFLATQGVQVVLVEYLDFANRWFDHLQRLGIRVWLRAHGVDVSARLRDPIWIERYRRYHLADGIIAPSKLVARRLEQIGIPAQKIHVVGHAVQVPPRPRRHGQATACVSVGRLVPKKAPLLTLVAFRLAHRQRPELTLDLIGDGPLAASVAQFVDEMGLVNAVRLHGQLDHAHTLDVIRHSDVLLHHAITAPDDGDSEGQPLVILEAMAAGLTVITTRHAGIPEIVIDGTSGRLVEEGDAIAMAHHIIDLAGRPEARALLGRAARRAIVASHTTQHARAHLLDLLGLAAASGSTT